MVVTRVWAKISCMTRMCPSAELRSSIGSMVSGANSSPAAVSMRGMRPVTKVVLAAIGLLVAYFAVEAIIGVIAGLLWTVVVAVVLVGAVAGVAALVRRGRERPAVTEGEGRSVRGIADSAGSRIEVGDTVIPGVDFDGPLELAFSLGKVVKAGRGKIQVRFDDDPGRVHEVTPGTVRRVA